MSEHVFYKCDRCGASMTERSSRVHVVKHRVMCLAYEPRYNNSDSKRVDICEECRESFSWWWIYERDDTTGNTEKEG